MTDHFKAAMREAARLTQAGRFGEATALIQRTLGVNAGIAREGGRSEDEASIIEGDFDRISDPQGAAVKSSSLRSRGEVSRDGAFIDGTFANAVGMRHYKLFVPPNADDPGHGLIVMLHGCGQDPVDFAYGTRMNALAGAQGYWVLYPAQTAEANGAGCWNWYEEADQERDRGEPALIAGMTRRVIEEHAIDAGRVYVAGLSAGGAMAATMAATYPELFAALGVHSGLPYAAANDLVSAMTVMRQGAALGAFSAGAGQRPSLPTIVFHGDHDTRVHPANAAAVIAQACSASRAGEPEGLEYGLRVEQGRAPGGFAFTRTLYPGAELWLVHGAGHGWSGGDPGGSYTEPRGPDASAEMLRFFAEHSR